MASQLLSPAQRFSWKDLVPSLRRQAATQLLTALEENAFLLANVVREERKMILAEDYLLLSVQAVSKREYIAFPDEYEVQFWQRGDSPMLASMLVPVSSLTYHDDLTPVVFAYYDTVSDVLAVPKNHSDRFLNSKIIGASLGPSKHFQLPETVMIRFKNIIEEAVNPSCVFWDYTLSWWSDEGCHVVFTNATFTECECNHLTYFAVLAQMPHGGAATPKAVEMAPQNYVVFAGVIPGIVGVLVAFAWLMRHHLVNVGCPRCLTVNFGFQREQSNVLKNLLFCLLMSDICFLVSMSVAGVDILCGIVAGFLHYFLFTLFAWMAAYGNVSDLLRYSLTISAYEVYRSASSVYSHVTPLLKYYLAICYGLPALVVAVSCAIDAESYVSSNFCWLAPDQFFLAAFVAPIIVILVVSI